MRLNRKLLVMLLSGACCAMTVPAMAEPSIEEAGDLPGGTIISNAHGVSPDGNMMFGYSRSANGPEAFYWVNGVMTAMGDLPGGGFQSYAYGSNTNGSVIVGYSISASGTEAFRWENGVMTGLGDLPGGTYSSQALSVSADGRVIVGQSNSTNGPEGFRWENGVMTGLGDLPGGTFASYGRSVSANGLIITGYSQSANGMEAFRWENGVMTGLGDLAGGAFNSRAQAISADGNVIVGFGTSANGQEAFRWENGVMTGLGDFAGGAFSSTAYAVNANGSVVVGSGTSASGATAFRWTAGGNMESLADVLTAANIDLTGWNLTTAQGVSHDGNVIVGNATLNGNTTGYIANLRTGGVTTPEELAAGLVAANAPSQQAQSALTTHTSQSLFATANAITSMPRSYGSSPSSMGNISPAAGGDYIPSSYRWSGYAVGSFGIGHGNDNDNWDMNGTTGLIMQAGDEVAVGAGIIGGTGRSDLPYGGESRINIKGVSVLGAYEAKEGFRFYGTVFAADLNGEIERHYMNGAGISGSRADTDGFGYGGAMRSGWEFPVREDMRVMPYGEIEYTKTKTDAYTERGGAFPASYSEQEGEQITTRLGAQIEYDVMPDVSVGARAAWAHRVRDENSGLSVSTTGFTGTMGGAKGDKDWAEGAVFTSWAIAPETSFSAEISARTGETREPQGAITIGLTFGF